MFRSLVCAALLALGSCALAQDFRRGSSFYDVWLASCRVSVNGARGSGMFIGVDSKENRCVILTNQHVVGNQTNATLQFRNGETHDVRGVVYARWYDANRGWDFALVGAEPDEMKKFDPPYFPLAGRGVVPSENSYIVSCGAPKGRFVQAWKGKILDKYNGSTLLFQPGPVPGQSGSAILSEIDGELWVTGILTWLIGTEGADDSKGGAIPIANLYEAVSGKRGAAYDQENSPIPPNATECAETVADPIEIAERLERPFVLEFSTDNCAPCVQAEADVQKLREAGVSVYSFNASRSEDASRRALELRVYAYPTFLVFDSKGKAQARFIGPGRASAIVAKVKELEGSREFRTKELEPEREQEPDVSALDALNLALPSLDSLVEPVEEPTNYGTSDFRRRAPINQPADSGFFDDADAFWRNRNKNKPAPEENPDILPKNDEKPALPPLDEDKLGDRLSGRLGGKLRDDLSNSLGSALGKRVDGFLGDVEKKIDGKINQKIEQLKKDALAKYYALRFRVFCLFLGSIVLSVFFAEAIKAALCWLYEIIKNAVVSYLNAKARKIYEATSKILPENNSEQKKNAEVHE